MAQFLLLLRLALFFQFLPISFATINSMHKDEKNALTNENKQQQQNVRNSGRSYNLNLYFRRLLSRKRGNGKKENGNNFNAQQLGRAQSLPPYALRQIYSADGNYDDFQTVIHHVDWREIRRLLFTVPKAEREAELKRISERTMLADFFRKNDKLDFAKLVKALEEGQTDVGTAYPQQLDSNASENVGNSKGKECANSSGIHSPPAIGGSLESPSMSASQHNQHIADSDHSFNQSPKHLEYVMEKVTSGENMNKQKEQSLSSKGSPQHNLLLGTEDKDENEKNEESHFAVKDSADNVKWDNDKHLITTGNDADFGANKENREMLSCKSSDDYNLNNECKPLVPAVNDEKEILDSNLETSKYEPSDRPKESARNSAHPIHIQVDPTIQQEVKNVQVHYHHDQQSAVQATNDNVNDAGQQDLIEEHNDLENMKMKMCQKVKIEGNDTAEGSGHHHHPYGSSPKVKERGSAGSFRLDNWRGRRTQSMPEGLQNIHEIMAKEGLNELAEENHLNTPAWKETFKQRMAMFEKYQPEMKGNKKVECLPSSHLQKQRNSRNKLVPGCKIPGNAKTTSYTKVDFGIDGDKMNEPKKY